MTSGREAGISCPRTWAMAAQICIAAASLLATDYCVVPESTEPRPLSYFVFDCDYDG